jgi:hypothetical protein
MYFKQRSSFFCLNYRAMYAAALVLLAYGRFLRLYHQVPAVALYDDIPFEYFIRTWYVPSVTLVGAVILTVAAGAHAWQRRDSRGKRALHDHGRGRDCVHDASQV